MLLDSARRAQSGSKAALFTVLGVPGVGKSRLVREATSRMAVDGWSVVKGRCLPYGDGITYWPIAEMVRELAEHRRRGDGRGVSRPTRRGEPRCRCCRPPLAASSARPTLRRQRSRAPTARSPGDSGVLVEHVIGERGPLAARFRGHPLGRAAAARPDRVRRDMDARRTAAGHLLVASRAARHRVRRGDRAAWKRAASTSSH